VETLGRYEYVATPLASVTRFASGAHVVMARVVCWSWNGWFAPWAVNVTRIVTVWPQVKYGEEPSCDRLSLIAFCGASIAVPTWMNGARASARTGAGMAVDMTLLALATRPYVPTRSNVHPVNVAMPADEPVAAVGTDRPLVHVNMPSGSVLVSIASVTVALVPEATTDWGYCSESTIATSMSNGRVR
jgi:hypothetical protein